MSTAHKITRRALTTSLAALVILLATTSTASSEETPWVIDAATAKSWIAMDVTVLDARGKRAFRAEHIERAQPASWQEFSRAGKAHRGKLLSAGVIQAKLRAKGVSQGERVIVVGDPKKGWGEDGRIVWMLRSMGHERAAIVDGGHAALVALGVKTTSGKEERIVPGDFEAKPTTRHDISKESLRESLDAKSPPVIIDTREEREYKGKTPYGESRGGHVPGAKHLHYSDLIGEDGLLLPDAKIRAKLAALGIEREDQAIVAYCTGGVRSGWFVVVLRHLGYRDVRNYAGSMWEWSAADPKRYPLN